MGLIWFSEYAKKKELFLNITKMNSKTVIKLVSLEKGMELLNATGMRCMSPRRIIHNVD
jgi:hypothetical protein